MRDDKPTHQERLKGQAIEGNLPSERLPCLRRKRDSEAEEAEASCAAFGYLRGISDRANCGGVPLPGWQPAGGSLTVCWEPGSTTLPRGCF